MGRIILHTFRGNRFTGSELAAMSGVPANIILTRLRDGWTVEQAVCIPTIEQRRRGVICNFDVVAGTGAGSTARETPEITFPEKANS